MKELESAVVAAFNTMAESGVLQKIIEEKVAKTVSEGVDKALGSYSDFGKALCEHIKKSLHVDFNDLGLVGYNEIVLKIIKTKLADSINTVGAKRLEKDLTDLLVDPPAEIKLSDLVEQFKEQQNSDSGAARITCIVDKSDSSGLCPGYAHIFIDEEPDKSKYSCDIQIDTTPTGEVYGLQVKGQDIKNTLFVGTHYGFERSLFQMYAAGTKIIIDDEEVDDCFPDDN